MATDKGLEDVPEGEFSSCASVRLFWFRPSSLYDDVMVWGGARSNNSPSGSPAPLTMIILHHRPPPTQRASTNINRLLTVY